MAQNTDGYRKQINNVNDLPGFDKMYLFAGAPTREFDKTFRYFLSCLGNITQDGSSLLDTYHQTDPGAGPGTPGGVGNPAQQVQHAARERRLHTIVLKHVDIQCGLYNVLAQQYTGQGRLALLKVLAEGVLPFDPEELEKMNIKWTAMRIDNHVPKFVINSETLFCWLNAVVVFAAEFPGLGKTNAEIYTKFLNGLPAAMSALADPELMRISTLGASYLIPALYAAPHPQAGNPNPLANQPDYDTLCKHFSVTWRRMIERGQVRTTEKERAHAAFSGMTLTPKMRCFLCGGLGHLANKCATEIEIPREILDGIIYPHIDDAATARRNAQKYKKKHEASRDTRGPKSKPKPRPSAKRAEEASSDETADSETADSGAEEEEEEDCEDARFALCGDEY